MVAAGILNGVRPLRLWEHPCCCSTTASSYHTFGETSSVDECMHLEICNWFCPYCEAPLPLVPRSWEKSQPGGNTGPRGVAYYLYNTVVAIEQLMIRFDASVFILLPVSCGAQRFPTQFCCREAGSR